MTTPTSSSSTSSAAAAEPLSATQLYASLTVRDLAASRAWYEGVLGFTVEREMVRDDVVRAVAIAAGTVRLLLNQDDGAKGWDRVKGQGFALTIVTRQSIDAIADRIRANGGTLDTEPADMPWGVRAFRLTDPDGYKLAFSSER